jgi:hypothetical protein
VDEPVCSLWLVCSVSLDGALWPCCAVVLGWSGGASVPPVVVLLLEPAVVPLFGLPATALEFAVVDCAAVESACAALGALVPPASDPAAAGCAVALPPLREEA